MQKLGDIQGNASRRHLESTVKERSVNWRLKCVNDRCMGVI